MFRSKANAAEELYSQTMINIAQSNLSTILLTKCTMALIDTSDMIHLYINMFLIDESSDTLMVLSIMITSAIQCQDPQENKNKNC